MSDQVVKRSFVDRLMSNSDIPLAIGVIGIISVLIIPIPPALLDFALAFNIAFSLVVLLTTLYIKKPLDLSVFPGMLLLLTLMRLSLNVASTRMILGQGYAGEVINSFGNFVVQGNYVVGFIIFTILVIIQFVVITKGAGRISEVSARFTLDAMPGKQMAIDADLNAGIITDETARTRREEVSREADFYGAMDGASKFVRGDAVAGILITLINIIGGFIIGVAMNDMPFTEALKTYTLLSIGDGLVSQIPALLVSTASGLIVTRAAAKSHLGADLTEQFTRQPRAMMISGGVLLMFGMLPGMPTLTFLVLGAAMTGIGYMTMESHKAEAVREETKAKVATASSAAVEERTEDLLKVDTIGLEIGYGLVQMVDTNQGGDLLERISLIRKQLASELGIIVPPIRIRDNVRLKPNEYQIKIKGLGVAEFELMLDHLLAINPGFVEETLDGFDTTDPAFGLAATWIMPAIKEVAEAQNFTVVQPSAALATHMTEVIRSHANEILTRQDTQHLVDTLKEDFPALVDSVIPEIIPLGTLHKVLQSLLKERVPVRDLSTIVETIADYIGVTKEVDVLTEYVRMALKRQISELYRDNSGRINVFTLDPTVEQRLADAVQNTKQGLMLVIDPPLAESILERVGSEVKKMENAGLVPVCLCSPNIRLAFKRLVETALSALSVVSYNEMMPHIELVSTGIVRLHDDN